MGYDTYYKIRVHGLSEAAAVKALCSLEEFSCERGQFLAEAADKTVSGFGVTVAAEPEWAGLESLLEDHNRWYDSKEDLTALSESCPGVTFELHGDGEETGDLWVAYFRDGVMELHTQPEWVPPPCSWLADTAAE